MPASALLLESDDRRRGAWGIELDRLGWRFHETRDLLIAVDLAIRHQPRFIITGLQLRDVTGYHWVHTLRSAVVDDVRVVGIRRLAEAIPPEARLAGFDAIVTEPFDFELLQRKIPGVREPDPQHRATLELPVLRMERARTDAERD